MRREGTKIINPYDDIRSRKGELYAFLVLADDVRDLLDVLTVYHTFRKQVPETDWGPSFLEVLGDHPLKDGLFTDTLTELIRYEGLKEFKDFASTLKNRLVECKEARDYVIGKIGQRKA